MCKRSTAGPQQFPCGDGPFTRGAAEDRVAGIRRRWRAGRARGHLHPSRFVGAAPPRRGHAHAPPCARPLPRDLVRAMHRAPPTSAADSHGPHRWQQEFPAWVRECDKEFKEKSCTLTHEGRTLQKWRAFVGKLETASTNPFRRAARHRCRACEAAMRLSGRSKKLQHNYGAPSPTVLLETDGCTCHEDVRKILPDLDTTYVPAELLAPAQPLSSTGKRKRASGSAVPAGSQSSRIKAEPGRMGRLSIYLSTCRWKGR